MTPPTITSCPASPISVNLPALSNVVVVTWSTSATDNVALQAGTPTITSSPSGYTSGSSYPFGTTVMTVVYRDTSGNNATCTFSVVTHGKH